jgi:gliding motility-associated-like protein
VINQPTANFNIQGGNVVIVNSSVSFINSSSNATSYGWDLCNGNNSTLTDINISYADTGSCCITLLAANGTCTNSVTKCIDIIKELTINIPNVFTPNSDSSNDLFKITGTGIKALNCAIFDRWGLKLYEWDGINGFWDGNVKSGVAPAGTYFFIINYTDVFDKSTTEKGFLNLFRN